ncbi:Leucine-rich repeat receptor-like protein kinase [Quillaja saponaria]|uniref:non-specific serine/threonine protein kinase n=1 Tax=Quillaja saponaria TaxID=32244 RepID=A0AAD7QJ93_QUISA|nr:Leucine-rich repeat receptor-like protein kinase [Quillaja saponaria]
MKPLLFFLIFTFFCHTYPVLSVKPLPLQLISLLSLKSSLKDPLSTFHDWDRTTFSKSNLQDPVWCTWSGIQCHSKTAQITSLDLSHRNLSGLIPPEICYLTSLIHLNISGNDFGGPFQAAIFELTQLRILDISHNYFNSTFPPGISKLKFLRVFNAYSNSFTGPLPQEFIRLRYLEKLNLGGSYFSDRIPSGYGSFPRLKFLYLAGNVLEGPIPPQLGFLTQLQRMEIGYNQFSGELPVELALLSNLNYLDISGANLSGTLLPELGNLTMLETLLLFKNNFTGEIPSSFGNLKVLKALDLSDNQLSGSIPTVFTMLKALTILSLMDNHLTGEIPQGIGEELPNLNILHLFNNSLTGVLPPKLGSNGLLQRLDVSSNSLTGPIPPTLCRGNKLVRLILFSNRFDNSIPTSLTNCTSLTRVRIQNNLLNGSIPHGFGLLPNLTFLDMSNNNFTGQIPHEFGNAIKLEYLNISQNSFSSILPRNVWNATNLQIFSASSSKLVGEIPDFVGCQSLYWIELQGNSLNGTIPWDVGHCEKLLSLNLSRNSLTGIIPWEISALPSITDIDLSHNLLTGTIPSNFNNCSTIINFNVSFNLLTGRIPSSGVFPNLHPSSFSGNEGLCGGILAKPCAMDTLAAANNQMELRKEEPKRTAGAIVWIMAAAFGIGLFVLIAGTRCFHANYSRGFSNDQEIGPWKLTAFQRLNFTVDDVLQCSSKTDRILGMGSTGAVYKAEMPSGEIIAVKKLWGKHKEHIRRRRGVLAEVDVLGNVRHRNIVRLLGCCSNRESTMLLYEYMPNGNLDDLLHGKSKGDNLVADWLTRYKIALGVAQGICYLHHDCDPVIVHRDLKPSNILLDSEMEARVADFGVAKLIQSDESMSVIAGSYGYIAPEYAYTLQVDEKSDIYSFGVVLMEILSGKRSVDAEFGDGNSIVDWIRSKMKTKNGIKYDILDKNVGAGCASVREEMLQMLKIALLCTSRNPADRPSMRDVVLMLQEAKPKRKMLENGVGRCGGDNVISSGGGDIPLAQKPAMEN